MSDTDTDADNKRFSEEYDPHEVCWVTCEECGYRAVSVHPLGVPRLECPKCGFMTPNPSGESMIDSDE